MLQDSNKLKCIDKFKLFLIKKLMRSLGNNRMLFDNKEEEWDTSYASVLFNMRRDNKESAECVDHWLSSLPYIFPKGYTMKINLYKTTLDAEYLTLIQYGGNLG